MRSGWLIGMLDDIFFLRFFCALKSRIRYVLIDEDTNLSAQCRRGLRGGGEGDKQVEGGKEKENLGTMTGHDCKPPHHADGTG